MKFKVGDKVRIRKDAVVDQLYNGLTLFSWMKEEAEDVNKITNVRGNGRCEIDTTPYTYDFSMLELVEDSNTSEKFVIYRDKNKTIAKYYKGDKTVTAEAKCALEDEFSFEYGAKLAMDRAIEKMKEEEIGYSWVRCVGYRQKYEFNFTVGKKYKIYDNGTLVSDDDFDYGMANDSKKETLDFISKWYIFEEV